jgi:hypothetical protein
MTKIVVRGGRTNVGLAERRVVPEEHEDLVKTSVKSALDVDVSRAGERDQPVIKDAADDDVFEVTLADGVRMWTSVAQMAEDRGTSKTRSDGQEELVITPDLYSRDKSRGFAGLGLKALRLIGVDIGKLAADEVARRLENRLQPDAGLYRCPSPIELDPRRLEPEDFPTDRPLLILLHGTASRTSSSFPDLVEGSPPRWDALRKVYDDAIFAFEHRTLTQSPIENACELMRKLPGDATIHLISHSRGGLVGELLCRSQVGNGRRPFEKDDTAYFRKRARTDDLAAIDELNSLLLSKKPKIERFVRVACPVRGTLLASKRLDTYLSVLTNLIGHVLPENPAYDLVSTLVLAVAKKRTDPETLPGIEAMMPSSPLVAMLNRQGVTTESDLSVIAGDLDGSGFLGRLQTIASDLYYREDHDLVVNTGGMYGGTPRARGARFYFDEGPEVNHFHYFRNHPTASQVVLGLTRDDGDPAGFTPDEPPPAEIEIVGERRRDADDRPVVFLLPGIMGSHLKVGDNRIWLDPLDLARGKLKKLAIDAHRVSADAPLARTYGDLIAFLRQSHEVVPFHYDWRLSLRDEAERLARHLSEALDGTEKPIRLIAHSMGGLVARAMIGGEPDVWNRMCQRPGCRLVMLGTPNGGSYAIPRVLLGHDRMVRLLAMVDVKQSLKEILAIVSRYPGLLEMLPADNDGELFDHGWWRNLARRASNGWLVPDGDDLESARVTRRVLDDSPIDRQRMVYVAGWHRRTPFKHRIQGDEIRFIATSMGDGRVPWKTGVLPAVPTYYMQAEHGELPSRKRAFPALLDLLQRGSTDQLSTEPPAVSQRAAAEPVEMARDEVTVFPTSAELEAAAVGFEPAGEAERQPPPLRVAVVHGNLSFSRHIVAVGHYEDDTIVGAEAHLDRCLDNRLSLRRRLGVYPGPIGTSKVVFNNPDEHLPGALVVGLGKVGQLSRSRLSRTFASAATSLALNQAECARREDGQIVRPTAISALLIGSSEAGIGVKESMHALIEGVLAANEAIEASDLGPSARITALDLIELYLDRAVQAVHVLRGLANRTDLNLPIDHERSVRSAPGGRRRVFFSEDPSWWRRVQVKRRSTDDATLVFTDMANRARADVTMLPDHRDLLDGFIRGAMEDGEWNAKRAGAMFELMLPNQIKDALGDERDLLAMVDETAAAYPWELLHDPETGDGKPLAVRGGLIRQFTTSYGSDRPVNVTGTAALVIGDPVTRLTPLPGARREARAVRQRFKEQGFSVSSVIGPDDREDLETDQNSRLVARLFARPYRIMHIAAHGLWRWCPHGKTCPDGDECPDKATGIAIGFDKILKPSHIRQIRRVPELVFLNTCHSGRIQAGGRPELAANLAEQFIRQGVRAVVAAGWPVHDGAANAFAGEFYDRIFANETFGNAVTSARRVVFESDAFGGVNTWGAYQCYGDPDYVLDPRHLAPSGADPAPFGAPEELICELDNIVHDSATVWVQGFKRLEDRFDSALKRGRDGWLERADVLVAIGRTSGELGRLEPAIQQIEAALAIDTARVPVRDVERLGLFKARYGVELSKGSDATTSETDRPIRDGIEILNKLAEFGETTERYRLLGSCWKRRAVVNSGEKRAKCLEEAERLYGLASELAVERTGAVDPHSLFNQLSCQAMRRYRGSIQGGRHVPKLVEEACEVAKKMEAAAPSFWNVTAEAEGLMARHLMDGDLHEHVEEIVAIYRAARRRGASPFQIRSIRQHLELIAALLHDPEPFGGASQEKTRKRRRLAGAVDEIHDRLEAVEGS